MHARKKETKHATVFFVTVQQHGRLAAQSPECNLFAGMTLRFVNLFLAIQFAVRRHKSESAGGGCSSPAPGVCVCVLLVPFCQGGECVRSFIPCVSE